MLESKPTSLGSKAIGLLVLAGAIVWLFGTELFPGNSRLYDAIADGDTGRVRQLLAKGTDPNSQSDGLAGQRSTLRRYSYSPLVYALRRDHAEIALALIDAGAIVDARNDDGATALWLARSHRMPAVTAALIARGATCQAPGRTACDPVKGP